jgi:GNAT superfamily N-acetyltransferase
MFNVRSFEIGDVNEVVELLQELSRFRPDKQDYLTCIEDMIRQNKICAVVACHKDEIIGFAMLIIARRIRGGISGYIEDVAVKKCSRGKGVGSLLMKHLLEKAKKVGCFKVTLESSKEGQNFYSKLGFIEG